MGISTINGPFSIVMLVITRGYCLAHIATQEKLAKLLKLRMKKKTFPHPGNPYTQQPPKKGTPKSISRMLHLILS
jgi:hypothetical protein